MTKLLNISTPVPKIKESPWALEILYMVDRIVPGECLQHALIRAKYKTLIIRQIYCKMVLLIEIQKNV